jgi:glutamate dehydrogenase/leucine dehydrogenase
MRFHLGSSPDAFADALSGELGGRGWLIRDAAGGYRASAPALEPLADFLAADRRDVRGHEAVFLEAGAESGALFAAVVHDTRRGQAQGGVRHWPYPDVESFLRDGLRLSAGMTRKNALARLWWGGGKGLIARLPGPASQDPERRRVLFREYGAFVSSLQGSYVTAEDAGTHPLDMAEIARTTRFVTCLPPERGGAGNPSSMTARGVLCAIEASLEALGLGTLAGKKVVLQGTGQVGQVLLRLLLERGVARVVASEICPRQRDALLHALDGEPVEIHLTRPGDLGILAEPCDVLAPAALGGVLGPKTIPDLRTKLVCGPANNPLLDPLRDAGALAGRGIAYVPDFVANRMGIVWVANEQYGSLSEDPEVARHFDPAWEGSIHRTTLSLFAEAEAEGVTTVEAAARMADALAAEPHPIWGHRAWRVIESLREGHWLGGRSRVAPVGAG